MKPKLETKARQRVQRPQAQAPEMSSNFLEQPQSTRFPQKGPIAAQATPWQRAKAPNVYGLNPKSASMARKEVGKSWRSAPLIMETAHKAPKVVSLCHCILLWKRAPNGALAS